MVVATLLIPIILFLLLLIVPIFELVGFIQGIDFMLYNEIAVVITQAALAFAAMVALLIMKPEYGRTGRIFWMLITPVALMNALCFVNGQWAFSILFAVVWSVCCFVVYLKFVPDSGFKAMSAVVSVLLAVALVVLFIVYGIFQPITNKSTVTESFTSPNGELIAEELAVDGVFSNTMRVEVKKANHEAEAVLGYYVRDSIEIYEGEEYETETAKISWKDDSTLIINDVEYAVIFE